LVSYLSAIISLQTTGPISIKLGMVALHWTFWFSFILGNLKHWFT